MSQADVHGTHGGADGHGNPNPNNNTEHNNSPYFQNNTFNGYDPSALRGGAGTPSSQPTWPFPQDPPEFTRVAQPSINWPSQPQPSTALNHSQHPQSPYYPDFHSAPGAFQTPDFGHADPYNSSYQTPFLNASSNLSEFNGDLRDSTFGQNGSVPSTISPEALQKPRPPVRTTSTPLVERLRAAPLLQQAFDMPKGEQHGQFSVTSEESLKKVVKLRPIHKFLCISDDPIDVTITKMVIPAYIPRKSRNEIKSLLAANKDLAAKITRRSRSSKSSSKAAKKAVVPSARQGSVSLQSSEISKGSPSSSEEESESEYETESEEEEEAKPPIPDKRPESAREATKYDTIKALWRSPLRPLNKDDITKGMTDFMKIILTIRDRWKLDAAAVKQAEGSKQLDEVPLLKDRVNNQRRMLEVALRVAVEHGHAAIVEILGEYLPVMQALAQFLLDRAKDLDYNGSVSKAILLILSKCVTLTDGNLDKTSLKKVVERFVKRGDDNVKIVAKRVLDNAIAASKKKKDVKSTATSGQSTNDRKAAVSDVPVKSSGVTTGVKRPLASEAAALQPAKRIAGDVSSQNVSKSPLKRSASGDASSKALPNPAPAAAAKPKPIVKPSALSLFAGLQSAKRPAATATTVNPQSKKPTNGDKKPNAAPAAATGVVQSSIFTELMGSLNKPKAQESSTKREENKPTETADQRAKRLRKEQRRKLRVTFKPDSSLVDVRYFTHDPDEELGHDASQIRDVSDVKSEGRTFKMHSDMLGLDDDDEITENSTSVDQIIDKPFSAPSLIDFSVIEHDEREKNYEPYGGGIRKPTCLDREIQERREANTLMAIYTSSSDIPSTPREAQIVNDEELKPLKEFGRPSEDFMSRMAAAAAKRQQTSNTKMSATDLAAALSLFNQIQPPQAQQAPQPPKPATAPMTDLEQIFARFSTPAQPAAQPPPATYQQPGPLTLESIFGLNGQQNPGQQNQYAQQHNSYPQQPQSYQYQAPNQATPPMPDVTSILAQLAASGPLPNQPQMNSMQPNNFQQQQYNQPQGFQHQQNFGYDNNNTNTNSNNNGDDRKRGRDKSTDDDQDPYNKRQKSWQKKPAQMGMQNGKAVPLFVVPCKYWKEGKCRKGAECTFLHNN